jgi:hypothetical protein
MKQKDDYIAGPHSYWVHFGCGFFFGAFVGGSIGWQIFHNGWLMGGAALVAGSVAASACGRWGDSAWHEIISRMRWFS